MQAEFNGHIQQTQALGHQNHLVVLKQGWLLKRSSNMRGAWKRRFFVLDSAGMLYYTSNKVCALPRSSFYLLVPWPARSLRIIRLAMADFKPLSCSVISNPESFL